MADDPFLAGVGSTVQAGASAFLGNMLDIGFAGSRARAGAKAYNDYQERTFYEDTRRMNTRLDALYPGSTPWERLGIQPSPTGDVPDMQNNQGFLPLAIAQLQSDTQIKTAEINANTQKEVAGVQAETTRYSVDMQTAKGALALANISESQKRQANIAADTVLKELGINETTARTFLLQAQAVTEGRRPAQIDAQTEAALQAAFASYQSGLSSENSRLVNSSRLILDMMPKETATLGGYSRTGLVGDPNLVLGSGAAVGASSDMTDPAARDRFNRTRNVVGKINDPASFEEFKRLVLGAAVAGGLLDTAERVPGFLGRVGRGQGASGHRPDWRPGTSRPAGSGPITGQIRITRPE